MLFLVAGLLGVLLGALVVTAALTLVLVPLLLLLRALFDWLAQAPQECKEPPVAGGPQAWPGLSD